MTGKITVVFIMKIVIRMMTSRTIAHSTGLSKNNKNLNKKVTEKKPFQECEMWDKEIALCNY